MDIGNIVGIQNDANEIIRYNYDQANQYITRSTNCGGANAFLGAQTGNPRETRIVNGSAGISLFRYYNGDGTELVPGTDLPSDIPDIRRIAITIVAETEEVDANLKQRRRMIYSTSVIPRNHAIN
jgi:YD repeat-containing protein